MDKTVFILRGAPVSGKTTLAEMIIGNNRGCICSADDYPRIYSAEGEYQPQHQADAHDWCFSKFTALMAQGVPRIAVANTNTQVRYAEKYANAACEYGYAVAFIHCEGLYNSQGMRYQSADGKQITFELIDYHRKAFQPLNEPPEPVTAMEVLTAATWVDLELDRDKEQDSPLYLISDLMGTLAHVQPGKDYVHTVDDMIIDDGMVYALAKMGVKRMSVYSNQVGVSSGHMTTGDLVDISKVVYDRFKARGIEIDGFYYATRRNAPDFFLWSPGAYGPMSLKKGKADKPNPDMLHAVIEDLRDTSLPDACFAYMGDAHTVARTEDVRVVRKLNLNLNYELDIPYTCFYIPKEIVKAKAMSGLGGEL